MKIAFIKERQAFNNSVESIYSFVKTRL